MVGITTSDRLQFHPYHQSSLSILGQRVSDDTRPIGLQSVSKRLYGLLTVSSHGQCQVMVPDGREQHVQHLQPDKHQQGRESRNDIHPRSCGHTYRCRHPQSRSRCQSVNCLPLEDDGTSPNETDARHHLRCYARHVQSLAFRELDIAKSVRRENHEHRRTQSH